MSIMILRSRLRTLRMRFFGVEHIGATEQSESLQSIFQEIDIPKTGIHEQTLVNEEISDTKEFNRIERKASMACDQLMAQLTYEIDEKGKYKWPWLPEAFAEEITWGSGKLVLNV